MFHRTNPPPSVKLKKPFALFRSTKGGGILNTWDEMSQNGFSIIDQQRKIAVKLIMGQDDALETVKEILINSYIDYLIRCGKEEA